MLASELIDSIKSRIERYWDVEVSVNISKWFGDYERKDIISVSHKWEDWLLINI